MLIIIFNIISALFRTRITPQHETHEQKKHTGTIIRKGTLKDAKWKLRSPCTQNVRYLLTLFSYDMTSL